MDEMWWPRGEDDGSVLKYVTEDEPKRAPQQIAHSLKIKNGEAPGCGGDKLESEGSLLEVNDRGRECSRRRSRELTKA